MKVCASKHAINIFEVNKIVLILY